MGREGGDRLMAASMAALPGVSSLMGDLGQLGQQLAGETEDERKKRMEQERQARLMGSTAPGASMLGLGSGPGGGMGAGGYGK